MIEAINLTKRFENKVALDSVNFEIKEKGVLYNCTNRTNTLSTKRRLSCDSVRL